MILCTHKTGSGLDSGRFVQEGTDEYGVLRRTNHASFRAATKTSTDASPRVFVKAKRRLRKSTASSATSDVSSPESPNPTSPVAVTSSIANISQGCVFNPFSKSPEADTDPKLSPPSEQAGLTLGQGSPMFSFSANVDMLNRHKQ